MWFIRCVLLTFTSLLHSVRYVCLCVNIATAELHAHITILVYRCYTHIYQIQWLGVKENFKNVHLFNGRCVQVSIRVLFKFNNCCVVSRTVKFIIKAWITWQTLVFKTEYLITGIEQHSYNTRSNRLFIFLLTLVFNVVIRNRSRIIRFFSIRLLSCHTRRLFILSINLYDILYYLGYARM